MNSGTCRIPPDGHLAIHSLKSRSADTSENAKPLKNLGKGVNSVFKPVQPFDGDACRVAYLARFEHAIVVRHSWKKKRRLINT